MHHAPCVGESQCLAGPQQHGQRPDEIPALLAGFHLSEDHAQVLTLHELHGEEDLALRVDAQLVDRNDSRVVQLSGDLGFLEEPTESRRHTRGGLSLLEHHLHRQHSAQVLVEDPVDGTHATTGHLFAGTVPVLEFAARAETLEQPVPRRHDLVVVRSRAAMQPAVQQLS